LPSAEYHLKIEDIEMLIGAGGGSLIEKRKDHPKQKRESTSIAIVRNKDEKNT